MMMITIMIIKILIIFIIEYTKNIVIVCIPGKYLSITSFHFENLKS